MTLGMGVSFRERPKIRSNPRRVPVRSGLPPVTRQRHPARDTTLSVAASPDTRSPAPAGPSTELTTEQISENGYDVGLHARSGAGDLDVGLSVEEPAAGALAL